MCVNKQVLCPKCNGPNVVEVIHGLVRDKKVLEQASLGKIDIRGCVVEDDAVPTHTCKDCGYDWGDGQKTC